MAVEISSLWPYETTALGAELDSEATSRAPAAPALPMDAAVDLSPDDRVDLVTAQNAGSLPVEPPDLEEALQLVRQVRAQLHLMDREEQQELYHFERLRELCFRLQQAP
ncbi:MAG: hypothetical protein FJ128_09965 [Deltaproteobacteria bacterium]|nr:hypothetical protein [Deltaproteobacteria bacterium]